jgi:DNA polymerase III delta subunit
MLYAIIGNDREKALGKLDALIESLSKRYDDPSIVRIGEESLATGALEEYTGAKDLFHDKIIIVLDELLESTEGDVEARLPDFKESENIFIVLQRKPKAEQKKKLEKYAEKIEEVELPKGKKESFDIFSLTDALGRRDRKQTWVLYQKAKESGAEEEQLHGMLFWIVKGMLLASASSSAKESGLSPFVYSKANGFAKNYTRAELEKLSSDLVTLYHESRRGAHELPIALEQFILSL